jgi:hypothetical protein
VIEHLTAEIDGTVVVKKMLVQGVAPGIEGTVNGYHVPDFQGFHVFAAQGRMQVHYPGSFRYGNRWLAILGGFAAARVVSTGLFGFVKPTLDGAIVDVKHHSSAPISPAVVSYGYEEASRNAVLDPNLAPQDGNFAPEAHGPDSQGIGFVHDVVLELGQLLIGVTVIYGPKQLLLGVLITAGSVATHGNPQETSAASLPLGLVHGVQDAFTDPVQVAASSPQAIQLAGEAVLDVLVFAAPPLEQ